MKSLSTHVLKRHCGVFIRDDNRSPMLQKLLDISLELVDGARHKKAPASVIAQVRDWEGSRKVKRVF